MEKITKEKLLDMAEGSTNPIIQSLAKQKIQEEFAGDIVSQKMIQLSQLLSQTQSRGGAVDEDEVKRIIREQIETERISFDNLDETVKRMLSNQPTKVDVRITQGALVTVVQKTIDAKITRPLIQKILSDLLARNNVYLYGGAGTGKSYSAETVSGFLGWDLITISCGQFTSSLEIKGGQTIDGYQEGKAVRAFGNLNPDGTPTNRGCVLLLDELPKIDPNTAGLLNEILAKVSQYKDGVPTKIENGKGDKIERGQIFIMATGNSLLNTKDPEYEANFKQDLSLQDRFAGSTYKVFVDERQEWEDILQKQWAFIFIFLAKLRKAIQEEGFSGKAFVSVRLMLSIQKTYNVFRSINDKSGTIGTFEPNQFISFTPAPVGLAFTGVVKNEVKTVEDSMREFFSLFTNEQSDLLKQKTDYSSWLSIVKEKNKIPLLELNSATELAEIETMLR